MAEAAACLGLHAVVADDEPHMRELLAGVLVREGFQVLEAASGTDVLELLRKHHVDMLVSDIMMPGLDGLAVICLLYTSPSPRD